MQSGELYHKNYYREVKDKNRVYPEKLMQGYRWNRKLVGIVDTELGKRSNSVKPKKICNMNRNVHLFCFHHQRNFCSDRIYRCHNIIIFFKRKVLCIFRT